MEYNEFIKKLSSKLEYMVNKLNEENVLFEKEDLLQEVYLYLWIEWQKGNLNGNNETYILKGCYFYLKNLMRKNRRRNILSLEELIEKNNWEISEIWSKEENLDNFKYDEIFQFLNKREKKVIDLILEGYTLREIGKNLGISHVMVLKILKKIKRKVVDRLPK